MRPDVELDFTIHALDVLRERGILRDWVCEAVSDPIRTNQRADGTAHFLRPIENREGRILRVVVSQTEGKYKIITAFLDLRLTGAL